MHVLAIGAHPDDFELGCGGTLLAHRQAGDDITLLVMTDGARVAGDYARRDEQAEAADILGAHLRWGGFQDGDVPSGPEAVNVIEDALAACSADVVYTHTANDTHQDHRATAEASFAAARRTQRVLSYESPSTLQFTPSVFVNVDGLVESKLSLLRSHLSQVLNNRLVDLEAVEAQARSWGFRARLRYAEAFESSRFVWDLSRTAPTAARTNNTLTNLEIHS